MYITSYKTVFVINVSYLTYLRCATSETTGTFLIPALFTLLIQFQRQKSFFMPRPECVKYLTVASRLLGVILAMEGETCGQNWHIHTLPTVLQCLAY